jgi:hypothetical protein
MTDLKQDRGIALVSNVLATLIPNANPNAWDHENHPDAEPADLSQINSIQMLGTFSEIFSALNDEKLQDMHMLSQITGIEASVLSSPVNPASPFTVGSLIRMILGVAGSAFNYRKLKIILQTIKDLQNKKDPSDIANVLIKQFLVMFADVLPAAIVNPLQTLLSTFKILK